MDIRKTFVALLLCCSCLVISLAGCSKVQKSPRGVVKFAGVATYDGETVPKGFFITFKPTNGHDSTAIVQDGGAFRAVYTSAEDGVEHGALKVLIGWDEDNGAVPSGFEGLAKSYSAIDDALAITVDKADENYKLDFPKK